MPRDRLLSRPFVFVFLAHLLHNVAFNLFLHLPGLLRRLGADETRIGWVFATTALTAIAARPPMGSAMDRRGRRRVILAGGVLHVLACGLYLTVSDVGPWVYVVRMVHGVAEASLFAALFALAADIVPASRRIEGIALFGVSGMLPVSIGGVVGDYVLEHGGFPRLFVIATACAVGGLLLSLPLRDVPRAPSSRPRATFVSAVFRRTLAPLWFAGGAFATALVAHFVFMKTFVLRHHIGSMSGFFSAYAFTAIALRVFLGRVPEQLGPKNVLVPAFGFVVAGQLFLSFASTSTHVALAGVLCGLGHGFAFPILCGLVVERADEADRGSALAFFTALFDLGALIGAPVFGAIVRATNYPTMFRCAAGLLAVATVVFVVIDRPQAVPTLSNPA
ncbi:MAG: MFS transporter [Deltaproteobacteria bacterium]